MSILRVCMEGRMREVIAVKYLVKVVVKMTVI